ncbi:hypothetical protein LV779_21175 [Streptomyces thinghirensis]|nr:hypothetical protein [Streptomyces thinghirensis]
MTFSAVSSAQVQGAHEQLGRVRSSRAPSAAECWARATSSSALRADCQLLGLAPGPKRRTKRFAVSFRCRMKGPNAVVKPRCGPRDDLRDAASGGPPSSSDQAHRRLIRTTRGDDHAEHGRHRGRGSAQADRPQRARAAAQRRGRLGSAAPMTSEVTVMPSWAPESLRRQGPCGMRGAVGAALTRTRRHAPGHRARRW